MPLKGTEETLTTDSSTEQLPGRQSTVSVEPSVSQPVWERQPHPVTSTILTTEVMSKIKQESANLKLSEESDEKNIYQLYQYCWSFCPLWGVWGPTNDRLSLSEAIRRVQYTGSSHTIFKTGGNFKSPAELLPASQQVTMSLVAETVLTTTSSSPYLYPRHHCVPHHQICNYLSHPHATVIITISGHFCTICVTTDDSQTQCKWS